MTALADRDPLMAINAAAMMRAWLADQIARAAVAEARYGAGRCLLAFEVEDWTAKHPADWVRALSVARGLLDARAAQNAPPGPAGGQPCS